MQMSNSEENSSCITYIVSQCIDQTMPMDNNNVGILLSEQCDKSMQNILEDCKLWTLLNIFRGQKQRMLQRPGNGHLANIAGN